MVFYYVVHICVFFIVSSPQVMLSVRVCYIDYCLAQWILALPLEHRFGLFVALLKS